MNSSDADIALLYVDGTVDTAECIRGALEDASEEFTVVWATSVEEAFELFEAENVDCVLCAYDMAPVDGLQFLQRFRARYPDFPFVLYTDAGAEEVVSDAIAAGVTDYVQAVDGPDEHAKLTTRLRTAVERHRRRHPARRAQPQLADVLNRVAAAIFVKDTESRYLLMNRNCRELLGFDPDEPVAGLTDDSVFSDEIAAQFRESDSRVFAAGETVETAHEVPTPDGTRIYLTRKTPLFDENGEPYALCAVATDITEQHERERPLEANERQLEERVKELSAVHRTVGIFESTDRPLEQLFEEFAVLVSESFQHPGVTEVRIVYDEYEVTTGGFEPVERTLVETVPVDERLLTLEVGYTDVPPSGSSEKHVPDEQSDADLSEGDGEPSIGVSEGDEQASTGLSEDDGRSRTGDGPFLDEERDLLGTLTRIAGNYLERRLYTEELERRRDLLRNAERLGEVGVWEVDVETGETYWSEGTRHIHEVPADWEPTFEKQLQFFDHQDQERLVEQIAQCLETGEQFDLTLRTHTATGQEKWIRIHGERADGSEQRLRGYTQDVTAQHQSRQRLAVLERVLRHNLRNDMNVIMAQASLIGQAVDGDLRDRTDVILSRAEELVELADKQREVARLLAHPQETSTTVDVADLVTRVVEHVDSTHEQVTLTVDLPVAEATTIRTVPYLEQAIEEVLENAIEHTDRESPTVALSLDVGPEVVDIRIADDGPGIPEHELAPLRNDDIESSLDHTSGIGLWLVKWLVMHAGGTVAFGENDPRGTVVHITLPQRGDAPAVAEGLTERS